MPYRKLESSFEIVQSIHTPTRIIIPLIGILLLFMFPFLLGGEVFALSNGQNARLVIGQPSFTTNSSSLSQNGLNGPTQAAFDSSGNMWVPDSGNNRILEFKPPFANGESASLVIGQKSFTTGGDATSQDGLSFPQEVVFDPDGNLWVSDSGNNRILEFKPPFANGESASLVIGQKSFTERTPATNQSSLIFPEQLVFDSSGNLWVPDTSNNRVLEFKPPFSNGESASLVIGQKSFTEKTPATNQSGLSGPAQAAFDSSGNMWVLDTSNNRVLEFKPPFSNGESASLVIGQKSFTANVWAPTPNEMYTPAGITFDSDWNLWVSDSYYNRILEFRPPFSNGESASLVIGQKSFTTGGAATSQDGLRGPVGIVFDSAGNLWVADIDNNRILEYAAITTPSPSVAEFPFAVPILLISVMSFIIFYRIRFRI